MLLILTIFPSAYFTLQRIHSLKVPVYYRAAHPTSSCFQLLLSQRCRIWDLFKPLAPFIGQIAYTLPSWTASPCFESKDFFFNQHSTYLSYICVCIHYMMMCTIVWSATCTIHHVFYCFECRYIWANYILEKIITFHLCRRPDLIQPISASIPLLIHF